MTAKRRNNVNVVGSLDAPATMVFAHGFGCDQSMWGALAPAFGDRYRVVLFDLVGSGGSDLTAYDLKKYDTLQGHADDVIEVVREFAQGPVVFVGHSVSSMIGLRADLSANGGFAAQIMVGPSPCYVDDGDYIGGFSEAQIHELLELLDSNHMGWSRTMAPVIMGNPDRPELSEELANSFCRTDPEIARRFARTTFLSDNRADLDGVPARCLVLQCSEDVIAPRCVGEYVHRSLPDSEFVLMRATGHCPNLSAPEETIAAIRAFL